MNVGSEQVAKDGDQWFERVGWRFKAGKLSSLSVYSQPLPQ